ncbi:hypothetical protein [Psychrosphaera haliotis]|uniref:hypothetical protein n=1 Tax=Psychrosphaera haliotis TaxID=555083 RepID=UPI0018C5AB62|nr:hypothetical protein [Psychrosphaera haliotis]
MDKPVGEQAFYEDIEKREDGGTPGFLQTIKAAQAIKLKDEMGVSNIEKRETHLRKILMAVSAISQALIYSSQILKIVFALSLFM